ncbi:DGQHR domain-containing protein [Salmonella enterica]|nr:DGQHR domain-containing protein [Salmonella enterica subsp. enterica serovar Mbandaka]EEJ1220427.1 DGQHR domain-containing protein [Salmonella enterica]ELK3355868.1 DGQHR domain-containing protein [Salmonella enterica]
MTKENTATNPALPTPKGQADHEFYFQFPGVYGLQGNTVTILINVPARSLARLLSLDNPSHTLKRSQREINHSRVRKFVKYLTDAATNGTPFIIPALTGNCNCHIDFQPIGNTMAGIAKIPMDAVINLFDGQHRAFGTMEFISNYDISLYVPILLTEELTLETRKQFFSDINNNASKPSATINMVYDGRNAMAQMMVGMLSRHSVFSEITDFENNIVPAKKSYFISFKAICDSTSKFIGEGENRLSEDNIEAIWQSWIYLTAIDEIKNSAHQNQYKKDYIQFHAVMINAFGYAIAELLKANTVNSVISMVENLAVNTDTWQKESFFLNENWSGVCVDYSGNRPVIIANAAGQRAAAAHLINAIKRGSFESNR